MTSNQTTKHEGTALEAETWLPLKEAIAEAQCSDATIKRAIKKGTLVGRKVGTGHNDSYEVSKTSFEEWLAANGKMKRKDPPPIQQPDAEQQSPEPPAPEYAVETVEKPKLTKTERRKQKAARKKEIPESVRRLRRWKNFMRHASQEQALAMIKWLSARLDPKKSIQKKILKEALEQSKSNAQPTS